MNKETNIEEQIDNKSNLRYKIIYILEILIFPVVCYILLETIKFGNFNTCIMTIYKLPIHYLIIKYMVLLSSMLIIRSITRSNFMCNCIFALLMSIIVLISYYKYRALELPFVPYDMFLAKNLDQIVEFGFTGITTNITIPVVLLIAVLFTDYLLHRFMKNKIHKTHIIKRIILFVIGLIVLYLTCISPNRYNMFRIKNDYGDNYEWLGADVTFLMHLGDFFVDKPNNYNEEKINNMKDTYNTMVEESQKVNPNVILIMNESYADITNFTNTEYSISPIYPLKEIIEDEGNFITGKTVSPVLGGGTSLPEFEVLTGLSSYFIKLQIYPYTSYIHSDMNSIVREFNKNDYTTIGIHTNTKTFYNRYKIYDYLGFQKTIFEEDIENPEYKGNYISDNEMAEQIIKAFEENKGKKFIFAVTMQNHMHYTDKEYENYDIEIYSDELTNTEKTELKNYAQGVIDGGKMYSKLAEYLKQIEEPTILIMFGDHLPLLGDEYLSTFKKNGFEDNIYYYMTPYMIWTNYKLDEPIEVPKLMSPSNLGIQTLNMANINNISWYLNIFILL